MFAFRVEGVEKRTFSYSKHAPNLSYTLQMLTQHVRVILVSKYLGIAVVLKHQNQFIS